MTPEDFVDDVEMSAADILKAFKGLSSTHGIPHVSNARGNVTVAVACELGVTPQRGDKISPPKNPKRTSANVDTEIQFGYCYFYIGQSIC